MFVRDTWSDVGRLAKKIIRSHLVKTNQKESILFIYLIVSISFACTSFRMVPFYSHQRMCCLYTCVLLLGNNVCREAQARSCIQKMCCMSGSWIFKLYHHHHHQHHIVVVVFNSSSICRTFTSFIYTTKIKEQSFVYD